MKAIKGYEGHYSATRSGDIYSHISERFIKPSLNNSGYLGVCLYTKGDGSYDSHLVHRLVAQTFLENPANLPCVNHKDKNRVNNNADNLEWISYSDNNLHSLEGVKKGSRRKYDNDLAHRVCKYIMDGWRPIDIADALGITRNTVRLITDGDSYAEVRAEYDWINRPPKSASINDETVLKVCRMLDKGYSYKAIEDSTGVSKKKISNIKNKVTYKRISESFHF